MTQTTRAWNIQVLVCFFRKGVDDKGRLFMNRVCHLITRGATYHIGSIHRRHPLCLCFVTYDPMNVARKGNGLLFSKWNHSVDTGTGKLYYDRSIIFYIWNAWIFKGTVCAPCVRHFNSNTWLGSPKQNGSASVGKRELDGDGGSGSCRMLLAKRRGTIDEILYIIKVS